MQPSAAAIDEAVARRLVQRDGVFARLMDTVTGGVFLAGLGLFLGADNFTIGVLASLPFFAQVAQFPALKLLMTVSNRKAVVVAACSLGRSLLLVIAAFLLLGGDRFDARILLVIVGAQAVFSVLSTAGWNWWMRDLISRKELGRYFGRRQQVTTLVSAFALPAAGALLDYFVGRGLDREGYALLFLLGGLFGWVSNTYLARTPHPEPQGLRSGANPFRLILGQFRRADTRRMARALMLVGATLTVALPFTAVFLLRSLQYSYFTITIFTLVAQLASVGSLRGWGHLSDHFGNRPVLQISVGMLCVALLGWSLAWGGATVLLFAFVLALHFVTGFAVGGIDLASSNILLKTAPETDAPAYLAALGLARAFTAGVATLLAGAAWQWTGPGAVFEVPIYGLDVWHVRGFHVLALASAAVGLVAMLALRHLPEEGAPVIEVARAMRREVRTLSSIAGIRAYVHVVSYLVEFFAVQARPVGPPKSEDAPAKESVTS